MMYFELLNITRSPDKIRIKGHKEFATSLQKHAHQNILNNIKP